MYDEKVQIELFEEIYEKQTIEPPYVMIELNLDDHKREKNFWILYAKKLIKLSNSKKETGIFRTDAVVTDIGDVHYYDLHIKHERIALEHKNTAIAKRANCLSIVAMLISIGTLVFQSSINRFSPTTFIETKPPEFVRENVSVKKCFDGTGIIDTPNLKPCPVRRTADEDHTVRKR